MLVVTRVKRSSKGYALYRLGKPILEFIAIDRGRQWSIVGKYIYSERVSEREGLRKRPRNIYIDFIISKMPQGRVASL